MSKLMPMLRPPDGVQISGDAPLQLLLPFLCLSAVFFVVLWWFVGATAALMAAAGISFATITSAEVLGERRSICGENPFVNRKWMRVAALGYTLGASLLHLTILAGLTVLEIRDPSTAPSTIIALIVYAYLGGAWVLGFNVRVIRFARLHNVSMT